MSQSIILKNTIAKRRTGSLRSDAANRQLMLEEETALSAL